MNILSSRDLARTLPLQGALALGLLLANLTGFPD